LAALPVSKHRTMTDELTAHPLMYLPKNCEKEICMPQYDDDDAHVRMHMRDGKSPMITDGTVTRLACRLAHRLGRR
jgi:hypothetical protein